MSALGAMALCATCGNDTLASHSRSEGSLRETLLSGILLDVKKDSHLKLVGMTIHLGSFKEIDTILSNKSDFGRKIYIAASTNYRQSERVK
jgi:hypothetical protein